MDYVVKSWLHISKLDSHRNVTQRGSIRYDKYLEQPLYNTYLELGLSTIARRSSKENQSWCSFTTTNSINFSQFFKIHL